MVQRAKENALAQGITNIDYLHLDLSDETAGLRAPSFDTLEKELFQPRGEIIIRVVDTDGDNQGTLNIDVSKAIALYIIIT